MIVILKEENAMKNMKRNVCVALLVISGAIVNVGYAQTSAVKFTCTLTDQVSATDQPGDPKNTFATNTPMIYLVCDSDNVKKSQAVKAVWIAADTNNAAPANYKIDEKSTQVPDDVASNQTYTAKFSLSKPTNGWPAGTYHVDLYVDNALNQSVPFSVK